MAQIFPRYANTLSRVMLLAGLGGVGGLLVLLGVLFRSPYSTDVDNPKAQPVAFSHEHHVSGLGLDCRYCHTTVETSPTAGIPPTATCMNCHRQIWKDAPMLEPVRESFRTGQPLAWVRINDLPDFAYFDHSIHIARGVGCKSCHGPVDKMPLTWQGETLTMGFCLDCHRDPALHLRPSDKVFDMAWVAPPDQREWAEGVIAAKHIHAPTTSCSYCHR